MSTRGLSVAQHDLVSPVKDAPPDQPLLDRRPWLSPEVSFHAIGMRGVLFDAGRQKLYSMNRSAAFMWCCLAEGYTFRQTALAFAMRAAVPLEEAERQLGLALDAWRTIEVATADGADAGARLTSFDIGAHFFEPAPGVVSTGENGIAVSGPAAPDTIVCRALDTTVSVRFADGSLRAAVAPVLAGLAVGGRTRSDERLDVIHAYRGRVALIHGGAARWVGARSRLAPMVFATLVRLALERSATFPAIHAAAAAGNQGVVLFPGASGSGKSTLAAGLLAQRHRIVSDDTVVLDLASMRVRPVAPVLSLKSGSWSIVEKVLPRLRRQPGYQRPDGALVRFLALERQANANAPARGRGLAVRAIVFPKYRPDRGTRLKPIGTAAALNRLTPCLDPIGHKLNAGHVERLIRWVKRTDCYALSVNSLDEAASALSDLLR